MKKLDEYGKDVNTVFLGKVLLEHKRLDSTNAEAERLLQGGGLAEGTIILAEEQWAGRGQAGNRWHGGKGENLTFSLILHPKCSPQEQFLLNQVISLGIADCLAEAGLEEVSIKWPNDIFIKNKKVAGMLIQNTISRHRIKHSIVGVGLNVNQGAFPPELPRATSLRIAKGETFSLPALLAAFCHHSEKWYLRMRHSAKDIRAAYHHKLYQLGKVASYQEPKGKVFSGIIRGVEENGRLLLEKETGLESYAFKEVVYLNP